MCDSGENIRALAFISTSSFFSPFFFASDISHLSVTPAANCSFVLICRYLPWHLEPVRRTKCQRGFHPCSKWTDLVITRVSYHGNSSLWKTHDGVKKNLLARFRGQAKRVRSRSDEWLRGKGLISVTGLCARVNATLSFFFAFLNIHFCFSLAELTQ